MPKIAPKMNPYSTGALGVEFTIGAETTSRTVAMKFHGTAGRIGFLCYLSNDATGDTLITTAPTGTVVVGTDGLLVADFGAAKKSFWMVTEENGQADLVITEAGAKNMYLNVVMPDGNVVTSPLIAFAA